MTAQTDLNRRSTFETLFRQSDEQTIQLGGFTKFQNTSDSTKSLWVLNRLAEKLEDWQANISLSKKRLQLDHPNILKMLDFATKAVQTEESRQIKYIVTNFFESPGITLHEEIEKRKKTKKYFSGQELLAIEEDVLCALEFLQKTNIFHGDVRPESIVYQPIASQSHKLIDLSLQLPKPSKIQFGNYRNKKQMYCSPKVYGGVWNPNNKIRHNPFKSDAFSLGMVILECGLLQSVQEVYHDGDINLMKFLELLETFTCRYADFPLLVESLLWLLDPEEKSRKDASKVLKLFGYNNSSDQENHILNTNLLNQNNLPFQTINEHGKNAQLNQQMQSQNYNLQYDRSSSYPMIDDFQHSRQPVSKEIIVNQFIESEPKGYKEIYENKPIYNIDKQGYEVHHLQNQKNDRMYHQLPSQEYSPQQDGKNQNQTKKEMSPEGQTIHKIERIESNSGQTHIRNSSLPRTITFKNPEIDKALENSSNIHLEGVQIRSISTEKAVRYNPNLNEKVNQVLSKYQTDSFENKPSTSHFQPTSDYYNSSHVLSDLEINNNKYSEKHNNLNTMISKFDVLQNKEIPKSVLSDFDQKKTFECEKIPANFETTSSGYNSNNQEKKYFQNEVYPQTTVNHPQNLIIKNLPSNEELLPQNQNAPYKGNVYLVNEQYKNVINEKTIIHRKDSRESSVSIKKEIHRDESSEIVSRFKNEVKRKVIVGKNIRGSISGTSSISLHQEKPNSLSDMQRETTLENNPRMSEMSMNSSHLNRVTSGHHVVYGNYNSQDYNYQEPPREIMASRVQPPSDTQHYNSGNVQVRTQFIPSDSFSNSGLTYRIQTKSSEPNPNLAKNVFYQN